MPHSRRSFLATIGAAAFSAVGAVRAGASGRPGERYGVQLYTLRSEMRRDVDAVLGRLAALGVREVEFAGYFDHSPSQIAALLRQHGLVAPSAHIAFSDLRGDFGRTLDSAARAGHTWVTVPWIAAEDRRTLDDWKRIAELFDARGADARAAGLRLAYHNHDFEFTRIGDVVPLELLIASTSPDNVSFQLDVYWATRAGFDPVELIRRHAGRVSMTHLKDSAGAPDHRMTEVGAGAIDFKAILSAARSAGVQHHFIEHDQPSDPFASVTASFRYLTALQG